MNFSLIKGNAYELAPELAEEISGRRVHIITSPPYNKGIVYDGVREEKIPMHEWSRKIHSLFLTLGKNVEESSSVWCQISDDLLDIFSYNLDYVTMGFSPLTPQALLFHFPRMDIECKILWLKSCTNPDGKSWGQFRPYTGKYPHNSFEWMLKLSKDGKFDQFNRTAEGLGVPPVDQKNVKRFSSCKNGLRCRGDVWAVPHIPRRNLKHPCPYPPELVRLGLLASDAKPGDLVIDPFCGIGSSGVAAKQLGVDFLGIDLSENYLKIANDRINETN